MSEGPLKEVDDYTLNLGPKGPCRTVENNPRHKKHQIKTREPKVELSAQEMSNNPEEPQETEGSKHKDHNPSALKLNQSPETQDMEALKQWTALIGDFTGLAQCAARVPKAVQLYDCCTGRPDTNVERRGGAPQAQSESLLESLPSLDIRRTLCKHRNP